MCTLLCRHAQVEGGTVHLRFPAKSGTAWDASLQDEALARIFGATIRERGPRARLLCWHTAPDTRGRGRWRVLTPEEVNADIHERTGGEFTAKDLRTLHGSSHAVHLLSRSGGAADRHTTVVGVVTQVAEMLGNTPAVARGSYIDPRILQRYESGEDFPRTDRTPESALLHLLRPPDN